MIAMRPFRLRELPRKHAGPAMAALLFPLVCAPPATCQQLLSSLKVLGVEGGARDYLQPAASAFGAAMTAGWFYRPPDRERIGLSFDFGLVMVGSLFTGAPRHFESEGSFIFNREQAAGLLEAEFQRLQTNPRVASLSEGQRRALLDTLAAQISGREQKVTLAGPTAVGPKGDSLFIRYPGSSLRLFIPPSEPGGQAFDTTLEIAPQVLRLPLGGALAELPLLPLVAPRITVGNLYGTQVSLRWLPPLKLADDVGEVSLIGLGIQHNPTAWLDPTYPVDLTLDLHWQRLEVEKTFISHAFSGGLMVSKTFDSRVLGDRILGVIPFAGAALEASSIESDYEVLLAYPGGVETRKVDFTIEGDNVARLTLGLAVQLLGINLSGEYNLANYQSFSAGLMVTL